MSAPAQDPFPRGALIGVGIMLAVVLAGTATARLVRLSGASAPVSAPPAVAAVDLRFADEADGSVQVRDAGSNALVSTLAPDTNGFVRGVMRGMARDRLSRHIGAGPPFHLSRDAAGRLWLQDTATGRLIDLEAFGSGNRAAFAGFMPAPARGGAART